MKEAFNYFIFLKAHGGPLELVTEVPCLILNSVVVRAPEARTGISGAKALRTEQTNL